MEHEYKDSDDMKKNKSANVLNIGAAHLDECKDHFIHQYQISKLGRTAPNKQVKKLCRIINEISNYHQVLLNQVPGTPKQNQGILCLNEFYKLYTDELKKLTDFQNSLPANSSNLILDSTTQLIEEYPKNQKLILRTCVQTIEDAKDNLSVIFGVKKLAIEDFSDSDTETEEELKK